MRWAREVRQDSSLHGARSSGGKTDSAYITRDVTSDLKKEGEEFNEPRVRIYQITFSSEKETGAPKYGVPFSGSHS